MARLLACLIVFALTSPVLGGSKNSGDKQSGRNNPGVSVLSKPKVQDLHEKKAKFQLEKEKIEPMKVEAGERYDH